MAPTKLNCWEEMRCGREPGGARVAELGPCPAATDTACDGINSGRNAGRLCWAVAGTPCSSDGADTFEQKLERCRTCPFFRRVKYEEGCHFQLLRPGIGTTDPRVLHRLLNDTVALIGICRDIFACLAERPLLERVTHHALAFTDSSSVAAYLLADSEDELVLAVHAGSLSRPERVPLAEAAPVAEAVRTKQLCRASPAVSHLQFAHGRYVPIEDATPGPAGIVAVPIGGRDRPAGALELVKLGGAFSTDDEWFIRELGLIAALGVENARHVEDLRQLKRFDKAKSRFVAVLMHHLASPLATIACSLQALRQLADKLSEEDRSKLIEVSLERIHSVQGLSQRLLDLASIRSGASLGRLRLVGPAEPLRQEVEGRLARAQELGVELALIEHRGHCQVRADPDGLRVIFANLLDNALKYTTGPVKKVNVSLAVERGQVRVCIRDTGIGIPPEDQANVFEEFHRAHNAPAARVPGHGLGLAITKELVERYGGHLELESTVGVGTAISVVLPLAEP